MASVFDPANGAVSATRTTSPPMLLGRKLLKNVATRNDLVSVVRLTSTVCTWSSSRQRQALTSSINPYMPRAAVIQYTFIWRKRLSVELQVGAAEEHPEQAYADGEL